MTLIPLAVSLFLFACAVALSVQKRAESVVSLTVGAAVTAGFGVQEMWLALASSADGSDRVTHVVASIAFTAAAALFVRLVVRQFRGRSAAA